MGKYAELDANNICKGVLIADTQPATGTWIDITGLGIDPTGKHWNGSVWEDIPPTKNQLYSTALRKYSEWQIIKTTRTEAEIRGEAAAAITVLQNKEDALWTAYWQALMDWYNA